MLPIADLLTFTLAVWAACEFNAIKFRREGEKRVGKDGKISGSCCHRSRHKAAIHGQQRRNSCPPLRDQGNAASVAISSVKKTKKQMWFVNNWAYQIFNM